MAATVVALDLNFRSPEHLRSEYHSFANLINVVHAELQLLERMSGPDAGLRPTIYLCEAATWAFKDRDAAAEHGSELAHLRDRVLAAISGTRAMEGYEQDSEEARELIREVLDDADLRTQQLLAHHSIQRELHTYDAEATRKLLAGPVQETGGTAGTETVEVTVLAPVLAPGELLRAVGRLAAALHQIGIPVRITAGAGTGGIPILALRTGPVDFDLVPPGPPSSMQSSSPAGAAPSLIALVSYVAGPTLEVAVDPTGEPLLEIRPR